MVIYNRTALVMKPVNAAVRPKDAEFDFEIDALAAGVRQSGFDRINIFMVNELVEFSGSRGRAAWSRWRANAGRSGAINRVCR